MLGSPQRRRPPHATGLSLGLRLRSERTGPTDADMVEGTDQAVFTTELPCGGLRSRTDCAYAAAHGGRCPKPMASPAKRRGQLQAQVRQGAVLALRSSIE